MTSFHCHRANLIGLHSLSHRVRFLLLQLFLSLSSCCKVARHVYFFECLRSHIMKVNSAQKNPGVGWVRHCLKQRKYLLKSGSSPTVLAGPGLLMIIILMLITSLPLLHVYNLLSIIHATNL